MYEYSDYNKLNKLQTSLGYSFGSIKLLQIALTHSSYANEHGLNSNSSNQRLEFLGDTVLGLVASEYLFIKYPSYPEGELTKTRAKIISEPSLALVARRLDIGGCLLLGKGLESSGGRNRDSILADASEAVIGAIFMDSNYETVRKFLLKNFEPIIIKAMNNGRLFFDYKTSLQEKIQNITKEKLLYNVLFEEGPDHDKLFYVSVYIKNDVIGSGVGRNKKEAEQMAAKKALMLMGENYE